MKFQKPIWLVSAFLLAAILLSSCNMGATPQPTVDPGAIETQAFSIVLTQVSSQQTQTAMAIPPTPLPTNTLAPTPTFIVNPVIPTAGGMSTTPLPGIAPIATAAAPTLGGGAAATLTTQSGCNDGFYEGETRPYDGAQMKPGEAFEKAWTIKNTGTCNWDEGYSFAINTQWSTGLEALTNPPSITIRKTEDFIKPGQSQSFVLKLQAPKTPGQYKWCWKLKDDGGNFFGPLVCTIFTVK